MSLSHAKKQNKWSTLAFAKTHHQSAEIPSIHWEDNHVPGSDLGLRGEDGDFSQGEDSISKALCAASTVQYESFSTPVIFTSYCH